MNKPILKANQLNLTGRVTITAKIQSLEVIETFVNRGDYKTTSYDISLKIYLDNGYWFYTPVHVHKSVIGFRTDKGVGFGIICYIDHGSTWFTIVKNAKNYYDEGYDCHYVKDELTPIVEVGQEITIIGTVQAKKRLNRVKGPL